MASPPTGTVTFLFTDIEGSARLAQAHPSEWEAARKRHHTILQAATDAHSGYVFQVIGDAFCIAFATAPDALTAAIEAQRALQRVSAEDTPNDESQIPNPSQKPIVNNEQSSTCRLSSRISLRVRMGLHTGVAELQDGAYHGYLTLVRVQRIMSVAHGGQILLSQTTADLTRDHLPAGVALRDLGAHHLRGLSQPEGILQVVAADLPAEFPPVAASTAIPNNLPAQLTSFIGRERELAELTSLLVGRSDRPVVASSDSATVNSSGGHDDLTTVSRDSPTLRAHDHPTTRLITLTGSGGTGKTRLSLRVAASVLEQIADGIWFVELASIADPALVPQTVAAVLGVREEPGQPLTTALGEHLRAKQTLLVLDNCEHVIDACARLADALLHAAPRLTILASSREALGIAGETTYHVPSLPMPNASSQLSLAELAKFDAIRLFAERAGAAKAGFALTEANAPAIAQICSRLDGIPLAIELAASRIRVFSPEQIASRLDDRFRLLTGGSRTALPRQQTLRGAIDWSHSLLSEAERVLLRRLSVFAGGWTIEAAEAVAAVDARRLKVEGETGPVPARREIDDGFQPSTSILQPSDILDLLTRLVDKSLVLAEDQAGEVRYRMLETIRQYAREKLLDAGEAENLRDLHLVYFTQFHEALIEQLRGPGQRQTYQRLALEHANMRAAAEWGLQSGQALLMLRLASPGPPYFWWLFGYEGEWMDRLQMGLARPEAAGHTAIRARALRLAVGVLVELGEFDRAVPLLEEGLAISREVGDQSIMGDLLMFLAGVRNGQGDFAAGQALLAESLGMLHQLGNTFQESIALSTLADTYWYAGELDRARALYEQAANLLATLGEEDQRAYPLRQLAYAALADGQPGRAAELAALSLKTNQEMDQKPGVFASLSLLAAIAAQSGQTERAVRLFSAVGTLHETWHTRIGRRPDRIEYERKLAAVRAQLDPVAFASAWSDGRLLSLQQAISEGEAIAFDAAHSVPTALPAPAADPLAGLTARERDVLRLLAQGLTDAQIADSLVISTRTVNSHLRAIYGKLDVTSRTAAVRAAHERGLV